ncbi:hypothetical protein, partial [Halalkalibaculum sp. DA384]|uniref:hypothetical protein n=1 Tax=Halalkalibaculum sp. DA384 TaxID=3373606 RepID=UPI0037544033
HFLYGQKTNQKSRWGMVDVPLTSSFPAGCFQTPAASPLLPAAIPQTPRAACYHILNNPILVTGNK